MKSFKRIISGVTALALACGLSLNTSAELKEGDSKAYKGTGYLAKCEVVSVKDDKSTVKVTLKNTSKKTINHWAVGFDGGFFGEIEDVKYGRLFTSGYSYDAVIRDCGTNGSVAPNQCVSFSFTMKDKYNFSEFPERIKVYSDINKSNTVEELNNAARQCCGTVSEFLCDNFAIGNPLDKCFESGMFANSNSKDGMKTGFNYKYKAAGDNVVNFAASQYARGNISVYVGRAEIDGTYDFFVQVKDNKTGKVGQFPRPTDGTAEWGTFDLDAPAYANFSVKELNGAAKTTYNTVAEYFTDLETQGIDYMKCFENGGFLQSNSEEGLKIDYTASLTECDKDINDQLKYNYEGMVVYVGKMTAGGYTDFFVQTKDPKTGKIGQYPHPTQGEATWGTYDTSAPLPPMNLNALKGSAKTAYNAVAECFADLETQGYDVYESYANGYFKQASTKDGLKIGTEEELTEGDAAINRELLCNGFEADITVYVGLLDNDFFFVQMKDNKTGEIGQYPDADNVTGWGEFDTSERDEATKIMLDKAARGAYSSTKNYIIHRKSEKIYNPKKGLAYNGFPQAGSEEGLKITYGGSFSGGDAYINNALRSSYEGIIVNVGVDENGEVYVRTKKPHGTIVGQYPNADNVTGCGEFDTSATMSPKNLKTISGNSKSVQNAVSECFDDQETQGDEIICLY